MSLNNNSDTRTITLTITENCNLSCVYCYEHEKSMLNMSFDTAKKILDNELKTEVQDENTYIEFFGGEPFLNFELIKKIVDYVLSFYKGKIHFFATTNGTLIHGKIQEWLIKYRKYVSVGLSLDGTKTAHNLNRCGSFDKIDIDFFLNQYPNQTVKMTISERSLPYLAESIKYIHSLGFLVECNLAYMIDWTSSAIVPILVDQLNLLVDYYLEHPNAPKCKMLNFQLELLSMPEENPSEYHKYCGAGTKMRCYDINGRAYPCQLFTPLSAGNRSVKLGDIDIRESIPKSFLNSRCANCYYLRICPSCLGSNYLSTGNLYEPDEARCKLYRIIFEATAKLKALQWERHLLEFASHDEEQALLRSIMKIQQLSIEN